MVLRIGYSLTGHENGPAPAEATGLEVDKLNRDYVKNYVDGYLKMYSDTVGPEKMGKNGHLVSCSRTASKWARRTGLITCSTSSSSGAATIPVPGCRH